MKIVLINYRYFVSGGPERYMFNVKALLERGGHEVIPFSVRYAHNESSPWSGYFADPIAGEDEVTFGEHSWTPRSFTMAIRRAFYDPEVHRRLSALLAEAKPDVAYVLHYLRKLSPAVLVALADAGVPTVVRLSDYGMVCPEQHMLRGGQVCDECLEHGGIWPSVRYRCIKGSLGASLVNFLAAAYHRRKGYFSLVDTFVTPSRFLREQLVRGGMDEGRITRIPTFVAPEPAGREVARDAVSYVGRIHPAKGPQVLVEAFAELKRGGAYPGVRLLLAGDEGSPETRDLEERVKAGDIPDVEFMGMVPHDEVLAILRRSVFSVVPSLCYDNLPNALLESWACATPVLVSDVGSLRETTDGSGAGLLFERGSAGDLAVKMRVLLDDRQEAARMGARGREAVATTYGPEAHLEALTGVLERARVPR